MLIYSDTRYITTEVNMMVLRSKDNEGYIYVHRGLYDQAVVLYDMFGDNPIDLCEIITGVKDSRPDVDEFLRDVPKPLNILGCFLLMVENEVTDPLDRFGALHVMSGPINFRKLIQIPMEARNEITFSLSIQEEYQLAWDRFSKEAIPFDVDFYRAPSPHPMNGTATKLYSEESGELVSVDEEEELDPDQMLLDALMDDDDSIWDIDLDDEEESEEEEGSAEEAPAEAPPPPVPVFVASEETVKPEPVQEPVKKLAGLDYVRSLCQ